MKIFIASVLSVFSMSAVAAEVVELRVGLSLSHCTYSTGLSQCSTRHVIPKQIQITLAGSPGGQIASGDYTITTTDGNHNFDGVLSVMKFREHGSSYFLISIYLTSTKVGENNIHNAQSLISIRVNNLSELNEINVSGESILSGNKSTTPLIYIGPASGKVP